MEFGVGIHGEAGIERRPIASSDELAQQLLDKLLPELDLANGPNQPLAVLINGMGGTPLQELYVLNRSVRKALEKAGLSVSINWVGNYMTSLEMAGASVSLLPLTDEFETTSRSTC